MEERTGHHPPVTVSPLLQNCSTHRVRQSCQQAFNNCQLRAQHRVQEISQEIASGREKAECLCLLGWVKAVQGPAGLELCQPQMRTWLGRRSQGGGAAGHGVGIPAKKQSCLPLGAGSREQQELLAAGEAGSCCVWLRVLPGRSQGAAEGTAAKAAAAQRGGSTPGCCTGTRHHHGVG